MRKLPVLGCAVALMVLAAASVPTGRAAGPAGKGKVLLHDLLGQKKSIPLLSDTQLTEPAGDQKPVVRVGLTPATAKPGDIVTLSVTVTLPPEAHTYSTNPAVDGATHIGIARVAGLDPKGEFEPDHAPTIGIDSVTGKPLEEFTGGVTWLRQYVVTAASAEGVHVDGEIELKYCNTKICRPFSQQIRARLGGDGSPDESAAPAAADAGITKVVAPMAGGKSGHAKLTFSLAPSRPKPGDLVTLHVAMQLDPDWHTYSTNPSQGLGATPTAIALTSGKALRPVGDSFQPDRPPELAPKIGDQPSNEIYRGDVTWTRRFKFEPKSGEAGFGIAGKIGYGVCNDAMCLPPKTVEFSLGDLGGASRLPDPLPADGAAENASPLINPTLVEAEGNLGFYLIMAFVGGIILNVMPCVLPVLAIKVLSFVQQAGESRSRVLALNLAYTGGVLLVFLTLATLAAGARLGLASIGHFSWGGLFGDTRFNLVMACLVFAMGLSLLGVFEIPVPGMIGSAAGKNQREGFLGAFLTGIFATLLATPCTGPLMATALGWSATQPTQVVYLVWGVMGLGMAFPYLVLATFPWLMRWLPKPGNWMVRFKEFAGFVLLGSVIFIVHYTDKKFTVTLLVMLLGVGLGLWMIGNLYDINSHIRHKLTVRTAALALTAIICWVGYGLAGDYKYPLPWEPFSDSRIAGLLRQKKTVLIDFTADWCANCHWIELFALNTREAQALVKENGVVTLKADFTNQPPEIQRWLLRFRQDGVPLTVIFPGGRQDQPIVLTGIYTKGTLLEKLQEAVASPGASVRAEAESTSVVR